MFASQAAARWPKSTNTSTGTHTTEVARSEYQPTSECPAPVPTPDCRDRAGRERAEHEPLPPDPEQHTGGDRSDDVHAIEAVEDLLRALALPLDRNRPAAPHSRGEPQQDDGEAELERRLEPRMVGVVVRHGGGAETEQDGHGEHLPGDEADREAERLQPPARDHGQGGRKGRGAQSRDERVRDQAKCLTDHQRLAVRAVGVPGARQSSASVACRRTSCQRASRRTQMSVVK